MNQSLFLIVDGHSYVYRAFHAIRQLNAPDGRPTNAIYGFIKMLAKLRSRLQPTYLAVVWDGGLCPERMALFPSYKAKRAAMPPLLEAQMNEVFDFLRAAGISSFCREGVEADDWIATLTHGAVESEIPVVIATSDKDFMQLVRPGVSLFSPHDKTETLLRPEQVRAKMGIEPAQVVDYLSLIGDSVDNIPGVRGIGPKTAAELLRRYGSVEALYQNLDQVRPEKLRQNLAAHRDAVLRNQRLVQLHADMPCDFSIEDFSVPEVQVEELRRLYRRWGFKALEAELTEASTTPALI